MRYAYQKSHQLNSVEIKRLRSAHRVRQLLRSNLDRADGHDSLENKLTQLLRGQAEPSPVLVDWCLCYGGPTIIRKLIDRVHADAAEFFSARVLRSANKEHILPKDHLSPEFQRVQFIDDPKTTLVCLTGNHLRLNIPIQIFNFVAADYFDQIIYLRDPFRHYFNRGINKDMQSLQGLIDWLISSAGLSSNVSIIGTSSGGFNALKIAQAINASKVALFSPSRFLVGGDALTNVSIDPDKVVIFFALNSQFDQELYEQWQQSSYESQHCFLDTHDHGTFRFLLAQGWHDGVFKWLNGTQPHYGQTVYI